MGTPACILNPDTKGLKVSSEYPGLRSHDTRARLGSHKVVILVLYNATFIFSLLFLSHGEGDIQPARRVRPVPSKCILVKLYTRLRHSNSNLIEHLPYTVEQEFSKFIPFALVSMTMACCCERKHFSWAVIFFCIPSAVILTLGHKTMTLYSDIIYMTIHINTEYDVLKFFTF